jgi:hypothetical protein
MNRIVPSILVILTAAGFVAADSETPAVPATTEPAAVKQFLDLVRNPQIEESWAIMRGSIRHKVGMRHGAKLPIEFRARFSRERVRAQLIFNATERYLIGQNYRDGIAGTTVIVEQPAPADAISLREVGIRPSDLTLSFLYWNFAAELPGDNVRGQPCRLMKLVNPAAAEHVLVWISTQYIFPVRVDWYRADADASNRRLEFTGFEKINDLWIVKEVRIRSKGWKTVVKFESTEVELITTEHPAPDDLFFSHESQQ